MCVPSLSLFASAAWGNLEWPPQETSVSGSWSCDVAFVQPLVAQHPFWLADEFGLPLSLSGQAGLIGNIILYQ